MKTGNRLTALIIEDDLEMAGLLRKLLRSRFSMNIEVAHDCATARRLIRDTEFDLITLDYRLPDGAGLDLLDEITDGIEHPPVIMVTGHGDEEIAARSFRSRASGYVVKDESLPEMLGEAVKKAIAQISLKSVERELLEEKLFIEHALNSLPDIFAVVDLDGKFFRWNSRLNEITGYSDAEITSMHMADMFRPEDEDAVNEGMRRMTEEGFGIDRVTLMTRDGRAIPYELNGALLHDYEGNPIGFGGIGRDLSGRGVPVADRLRLQLGLEELVKDSASELRAASDELRDALEETSRAGEALRSGERYYRSILDNSIDVIAILDGSGNMMDISPSVERVLGRAPSEATGRELLEIVHPDDAAALQDHFRLLVKDPGRSATVESRLRHLDGGWHIFELVGRSFMMEDGAVRVVENARDITDRKSAEMELRERERQLRLITDNMQDVIAQVDTAGVFLYVSPSYGTLLGHDPAESVGRSALEYLELIHPDDIDSFVRAFQTIMSDFEPARLRYRFKHSDGYYLWLDSVGVPLYDQDQNLSGAVFSSRDITEAAEAEEALRESEERYRTIFDLSPDFVYLVSPNGSVVDANRALLERTGLSLEEIRRTGYMDFFAGEDPEGLRAAVGRLMSGGEVRGLVVRARSGTGKLYYYEINAIPLMEGDKVRSILSLARDITGRIRTEEELRSLNRELEGFAETVSHDLRTPLTSIKLAGETLARMWQKRDEVEELGSEIERIAEVISLSASQAEALIEDLLQLARAGQQPSEVVRVDISKVVARVLEERSALIAERGTQVEADESLGTVQANPSHMYQLFGNIVDNAVRHNRNPEPRVTVRYLGSDDGSHHYSVEDNGAGIPPGDRENVFLPFFKGEEGATGIGLAIVKKLINLYDGSIEIAGDAASRFNFTITDLPA
ncbi:MAG: PAS domain S-box protein [Actinobacteria bacterium]|nr:PAS domain S-box protein [Actinomycetota bacterium]MBU1944149.1 PAS domain S-box protein [Actinomycetota bacterium]MBU2687468.1 PAS domain S-box protein [Actinomycetota bacterium]